jgi:hypothetical protein
MNIRKKRFAKGAFLFFLRMFLEILIFENPSLGTKAFHISSRSRTAFRAKAIAHHSYRE